MAVLRLLNVVIENYPEGEVEMLGSGGCRHGHAPGAVLAQALDRAGRFLRDVPPKYYRLSPGTEVRLRYAYFVTCVGIVKDERTGEVVEVRCAYDPATRGGEAPDGCKVKGTIHWGAASHALGAEVRPYEHLFLMPRPDQQPGDRYQFERHGYFCVPPGLIA